MYTHMNVLKILYYLYKAKQKIHNLSEEFIKNFLESEFLNDLNFATILLVFLTWINIYINFSKYDFPCKTLCEFFSLWPKLQDSCQILLDHSFWVPLNLYLWNSLEHFQILSKPRLGRWGCRECDTWWHWKR